MNGEHRVTNVALAKRKPGVDLRSHHALCEMNFHQLIRLLPGIKRGVDQWSFAAGNYHPNFEINVRVIEDAPYTTTIEVEQNHVSIVTPRIVVRLYHDVSMAEIVSWDHHRYWLPEYPYPNPKMYHPDEKLALNRFLGDWLDFCRKQGRQEPKTVMQFS